MAESEANNSFRSAPLPVWTAISLRRSGARPLRFNGALVVTAQLPPAADRLGHAIRLFETSDGRMAVAMELWTVGCEVPTADACIVGSAEELVQACESFDPRERMSADFSGSLFDVGCGGVATKVAIELRLEATEADYRANVLAILRDPHAQSAAT